jgi:hypothetical protein
MREDDERRPLVCACATAQSRFHFDVLREVLQMTDVILEIASGSGEPIVHFARSFPALVFQSSDPEPDVPPSRRLTPVAGGHRRGSCPTPRRTWQANGNGDGPHRRLASVASKPAGRAPTGWPLTPDRAPA